MSNILVIKLGALGDFIQSLGPMAAIRRHHAGDFITLLTTKPFEDLAQASGYFNEVWIDARPKWLNLKGWLDLRGKLNGGQFARVYDLQNNDRTSLYFRLFTPRPEWVGVAKGASHRNIAPERTAGLAFDGHVQTLKLAGIDDVQIDDLSWMQADLSKFALKPPYVLIVPGCAANRPEKRWPAEYYIQLCQKLAAQNYQPVLIGTHDEKDVLDLIESQCPACLNLGGKTALTDLPALAHRAAAAIGNDTGPMHMIGPAGKPALILFSGHSNPARHAPTGTNVTCLQKQNLKDLSVEEVLESFAENIHTSKEAISAQAGIQ